LWREFCDRFEFEDKDFVSAEKLLLFPQQVVLKITVKPPQKRRKGKRKIKAVEDDAASSSSDEDNEVQATKLFEAAAEAIDESVNEQPEGAPLKPASRRKPHNHSRIRTL
jgi:hypothetical protein